MGPKFELGWVETREGFRAHLMALADRSERGAGPRHVQWGADDVASHLRRDGRNLVVLPESLGLMAAFTGSRAAVARESPVIEGAIGSLLGAYAPQSAYYGARHPRLAERVPPTRLLALALTDTFARAAVEPAAELADRLDAWVVTSVDMTQDWRIVCADRSTYRPPPGGGRCEEESPTKVAQLMTTDESRDYAYEATSAKPSVMALLFGPDGRLVSKQVKTYLTPLELAGGLDLVPGHVSGGLGAVRTPVGTLGFVTSKDAWMPDVTAKLDARGVDVLVQPEFFVGETASTEGMWAADNYKASGYSALLRHPSLRSLVAPSLTGNVFSLSADVQQLIAVAPRRGTRPRGGLIGQRARPGFLGVGRYVIRDPVERPIPERRRILGRAGEALLPGSGAECPSRDEAGPCEGGQVEDVIWADVEVGARRGRIRPVARRKRGPTPFTVARPPGRVDGEQRNVALAAQGRCVWAAFEEGGRVVVTRSVDRGRSWRRLAALPGSGRQWWPAISAGPGGRVWLAWTEENARGAFRARYVVSRGGSRFGRPRALDAGPPRRVNQWKPAIAATGRRSAVAAWVDERDPVRGAHGLAEAGIFTNRLAPDGPRTRGRRVDTGEPVELARTLDHSWAPSLAVRGGRVLLAYLDFRTYDWRVHSRLSRDHGATWDRERTVAHAPSDVEALADTPRAALGPRGRPLLAFTDYRKRDSARRPHQLYDVAVASRGGRPLQVDGHGARQVSAFAPSLAWVGRRLLVAWQDHARGDADVRARLLGPVGAGSPRRGGRVVRVDDAGPTGWNAWRPAVAGVGAGRVLVAWEDDRDGRSRVLVARARVRGLR